MNSLKPVEKLALLIAIFVVLNTVDGAIKVALGIVVAVSIMHLVVIVNNLLVIHFFT